MERNTSRLNCYTETSDRGVYESGEDTYIWYFAKDFVLDLPQSANHWLLAALDVMSKLVGDSAAALYAVLSQLTKMTL